MQAGFVLPQFIEVEDVAPLVQVGRVQAQLVFELVVPALGIVGAGKAVHELLRLLAQRGGPDDAQRQDQAVDFFPVAAILVAVADEGFDEQPAGVGPVVRLRRGCVDIFRGEDLLPDIESVVTGNPLVVERYQVAEPVEVGGRRVRRGVAELPAAGIKAVVVAAPQVVFEFQAPEARTVTVVLGRRGERRQQANQRQCYRRPR